LGVQKAELVGTVRRLGREQSLDDIDAIMRAAARVMSELAYAADWGDDGISAHMERVARTSRALAEQLHLPEHESLLIYQAAPLHDVGKLAVPAAILLKPGLLSPIEFERVKGHTTTGAAILSCGGSELMRVAEEIALTHHEWWDGRGYPAGLLGRGIPLTGRIVALADVFDALTHERPYKEAWSFDQAVRQIRALRAIQFDPDVVDAFLELDPEELVALPERRVACS
jgi:putative two-component system response regulator